MLFYRFASLLLRELRNTATSARVGPEGNLDKTRLSSTKSNLFTFEGTGKLSVNVVCGGL